jgi:hypothetical protein
MTRFGDPGPCPVDDMPHTTCTSADEERRIVIVQLPARDELLAAARPPMTVPPIVTLQPGEFTTATYRRPKKGAR